MSEKAFQDYYPDNFAQCYGCGRLNAHGLHVRSFWDGEESVAAFTPQPYHTAIPGYVYGGLIASLIDCHGTGTAAGAAHRQALKLQPAGALTDETTRPYRYVTASLKVDYLRPTPLGPVLELRGVVKEFKGRKAVIDVSLSAEGQLCARGEVICVQIPDPMAS